MLKRTILNVHDSHKKEQGSTKQADVDGTQPPYSQCGNKAPTKKTGEDTMVWKGEEHFKNCYN
jgi:hypothetical protein